MDKTSRKEEGGEKEMKRLQSMYPYVYLMYKMPDIRYGLGYEFLGILTESRFKAIKPETLEMKNIQFFKCELNKLDLRKVKSW